MSTVGVDTSNGGRADETWTVLRLILWSADYLKEKGIVSGRLDAEHLLASVVGVGRLQLYLEFERPLTMQELDGFRPLVKRRAAREPLQYIIGRQPFRELDLEVGPGVLIPRPETELLVGKVLEWLEERALQDAVILDVGTGTGAISLSIATEGRGIRVTATDVSDAALEIAGRNRDAAELSSSVELRKGSVFEPLTDGERFDVITSNPPYVPEVDEEALEPEVRDWEPREALFAGADGMNVLRRIVSEAGGYLKPDGLLALEVGFGQAQDVAGLLEATGEFKDIRVLRDYAGKERFVFAHGA